jgi:hypothetical protein
MLMQDDIGWFDFGCYLGGAALDHPTPNVDRMAKEGAMFTCWYGQASCTAGRTAFITGRISTCSALSGVAAPGDENRLKKETPTIAEFFQKNGYTTYFSGKWHLGDHPGLVDLRPRSEGDHAIGFVFASGRRTPTANLPSELIAFPGADLRLEDGHVGSIGGESARPDGELERRLRRSRGIQQRNLVLGNQHCRGDFCRSKRPCPKR